MQHQLYFQLGAASFSPRPLQNALPLVKAPTPRQLLPNPHPIHLTCKELLAASA
jgi:hypothetical protein